MPQFEFPLISCCLYFHGESVKPLREAEMRPLNSLSKISTLFPGGQICANKATPSIMVALKSG